VTDPSRSAPSAFERALAHLLRPFAKVEAAEAITAGLLTLTVFLLLTAYYLLKTAREPLILLHGGAEVKQYAAAGQALLMAIVVNAYSALARRVGRVVSRVMGGLGVRNALLVLPAVAFLEYGSYLVAPILSIFTVAKVGESSLEYSLQNTARQALFLVGSRIEKYIGKTVVDTFIVRAGDALTALVVLAGSRAAISPRAFAAFNLLLVALWIVAVFAIGRENARRSGEGEERIALEPLPS